MTSRPTPGSGSAASTSGKPGLWTTRAPRQRASARGSAACLPLWRGLVLQVNRRLECEDLHRDVAPRVDSADEGQRAAAERLLHDAAELVLQRVLEEQTRLAQPVVASHRHQVTNCNPPHTRLQTIPVDRLQTNPSRKCRDHVRPGRRGLPAGLSTIPPAGRLAQLVERLPYKQEVTGSSPVPPIGDLQGFSGIPPQPHSARPNFVRTSSPRRAARIAFSALICGASSSSSMTWPQVLYACTPPSTGPSDGRRRRPSAPHAAAARRSCGAGHTGAGRRSRAGRAPVPRRG
jgi:hypothetical protein